MSKAGKVYLTVALVAGAATLAWLLRPRVGLLFAPEPTAAYVALEYSGSGTAVVGPIEVPAGESFRLHAVLEARGRGGQPVYYTEAPVLEIGGSRVAPERLRHWDPRGRRVRLLWFTVEPWSRFVDLEPGQGLDQVRYQEFFHPEWPMQWSVEGRLDARTDESYALGVEEPRRFGTQRYQVWIELYPDERALVPSERYKSWGVTELEQHAAEFPTASVALPGAAGPASTMFGLPGVALPEDAPPSLLDEVARRAEARLLFTQVRVLRETLRVAGAELESVEWQRVELGGGSRWGEQRTGAGHAREVSAGDLLRVGARWVVAYRDGDGDGLLDPSDLCLDFEQGAAIRRLGDIFVGEGEIEWAHLAR